MNYCLLCGETFLAESTLKLGSLVACNRFEKHLPATIQEHALSITECAVCNLVQLSEYPSIEKVRPSLPWIRYNEPSAHLDAVVERMKVHFPTLHSVITIGIGPFDTPLLERMIQRGCIGQQLNLSAQLRSESNIYPYLETIQAALRPDLLREIALTQGTAHLVSCRYLLEHSHDPIASLKGLSQLLRKDGFLLVEVPDSSKFLCRVDYSSIWEEHICYFTEETFRACAQVAGYDVVQFTRYTGLLEDALVFLLHPNKKSIENKNSIIIKNKNSDAFIHYKFGFQGICDKYRKIMQAIESRGKKIAIYGAGHQSIMFINLFKLSGYISYAIDDAPEKNGYLLPGTAIPIVSSEYLKIDQSIEICLLGVAPSIQEKIRNKSNEFLNRGGSMYTIFPGLQEATIID